VAQALGRAVAGLDRFTMEARITGTVDSPQIRLRSSLEAPLRQAVAGLAREKAAELQARLEGALAERLAPHLAGAEDGLAKLGALDSRAQERVDRLQELRKSL
jgi:hypothetical protein